MTDFADFLFDNNISGALVLDEEGKMLGVASFADLASVLLAERSFQWDPGRVGYWSGDGKPQISEQDLQALNVVRGKLLVGDIMTRTLYSVQEDAPVSQVAAEMIAAHIHRMVVKSGDEAVGVITSTDLLGLLAEEAS